MSWIHFDVIMMQPYPKLADWMLRYKSSIRSLANFKELEAPVGQEVMTSSTKAWLVWYRRGDWKTGQPIRAKAGKNPILVRVPAVKLGDRFLVIDGCHRLTELSPRFVVIDYVELTKEQAWRCADFVNPFWKKHLKTLPGKEDLARAKVWFKY